MANKFKKVLTTEITGTVEVTEDGLGIIVDGNVYTIDEIAQSIVEGDVVTIKVNQDVE